MANNTSKEYSTKEISHMTDIAESTIRKYALLLERAGWLFLRNENGYRVFTEKDIFIFNEFKNLSKKNLQVDDIAKIIASKHKNAMAEAVTERQENLDVQGVSPVTLEKLLEKMDMLLQENEIQKQFNQELLRRLDQQSRYIEESLEKRDQHLLASIREVQEIKLLAAAAEEKKKKWFEFWK